MKGTGLFIKTAVFAVMGFSLIFGVQLKTDNADVSLNLTGDASLQAGQAVNYFYKDYHEYHHQWIQQSLLHLGFDALYGEKVRIQLGMEGRLWFSLPDQSGKTTGQAYALYDKVFTYSIYNAAGTYILGKPSSGCLEITAGLFRYKYNPEVRNLGEYLFRSLAYPAVLVNDFDKPDARLAGFKVSGTLPLYDDFFKLHGDLMLTFETEMYPFFDATPSFIGNCVIGKFLDIGAGVSLTRFFPVNDSLTTPKTDPKSRYVTSTGDTGYYTYAGTKVMGRIMVDPKRFIPFDRFGPEDLKIYAEAAVLGLENYPRNDTLNSPAAGDNNIWGYDTLLNKVPVVFGFNFPAFKVFDVASLEFEWYGCKYPMNLANAVRLGNQYAYPIPAEYNKPLYYYTSDNWKWSVYIKKMFAAEHYGFVVQVARDHLRFQHILDEPKVYEEALIRPNDWWWTTKFIAQF